jgi:DNA invertase Pin-like site-specific DNA recombinase
MRQIVTYIRVSTRKQKESGLGLEAQERAIAHFAEVNELKIVKAFTDTASGAAPLTKRPQLAEAIATARKLNCPVVVARLDRLSGDVHFISGLMAEKVVFVVTTIGFDVDPFMLHIYAAVAQKERALISQRTREALKGRVLSGQSLRKLTLETETAIYDAHENGVASVQLAEQHGLSRQAVNAAIRRYKKVRLGQ